MNIWSPAHYWHNPSRRSNGTRHLQFSCTAIFQETVLKRGMIVGTYSKAVNVAGTTENMLGLFGCNVPLKKKQPSTLGAGQFVGFIRPWKEWTDDFDV